MLLLFFIKKNLIIYNIMSYIAPYNEILGHKS